MYWLHPGPNSIKDALRMFIRPIRNGDPHLDFYTVYHREATVYDADYIKKYDEDLNTTSIFVCCSLRFAGTYFLTCPQAGLFSAVSSAFVIDLEPDTDEQSVVCLRAILFALAQSAITRVDQVTSPPLETTPSNLPPLL